MIKFFRRIRQKLIDEGNLKGYVFYAFGEILLVVIGIVIALQIDNWNENRINQSELREILLTIKANLQSDIEANSLRGNTTETKEFITALLKDPTNEVLAEQFILKMTLN